MKSKKHIDQLVEESFDSISRQNKVKTSPFFKEKVLTRIAQSNSLENDDIRFLDWFTPKYQAAALICFVVLNSVVLWSYTYNTDGYSENVEKLAEAYGISETETESYLNQN